MTPLSSKDCVTTEQKAAFMLEACKPEWRLFCIQCPNIAGIQHVEFEITDPDGCFSWDFSNHWYELRPAPLTAEQKVAKVLEFLETSGPNIYYERIIGAIAILKGESRGD